MLIETTLTARRAARVSWLAAALILAGLSCTPSVYAQTALLYPARERLRLPSQVDSNSPLTWLDGTLYLYTSIGLVVRSSGRDLSSLANSEPIVLREDGPAGPFPGSAWIESVYRSADAPERLYGWYHHEIEHYCLQGTINEPVIGAAVSDDNGVSWQNLGLILTATPGSFSCTYQNGYFGGGHGDFSVIKQGAYFYIFYTNYAQPFEQQGVSVARVHEDDLDAPADRVFKYYDGEWDSPGLGGGGTPIWPARVSWERYDPDSFWGPSLHYNHHLDGYVLLMNRAIATGWVQEGIYYSFNRNLENPAEWSAPVRLNVPAGSLRWYPEVIGTAEDETNSYVGAVGRLFMSGVSDWYIRFFKPGELIFSVSPASLCPVVKARAEVTNAQPNSAVRLVEEKLTDGRWQVTYDNSNEGMTDAQGRWSSPANYIPGAAGENKRRQKSGGKWPYAEGLPDAGPVQYRAYVEVAGSRSDYASYELYTKCRLPTFTVAPAAFCPTDEVTAQVTNALPNSPVRLVEEKLIEGEWQVVYESSDEGMTDAQGRWSYASNYIPGVAPGQYRAYVEVSGLRSAYASYELRSCH